MKALVLKLLLKLLLLNQLSSHLYYFLRFKENAINEITKDN